MSTTVGEVNTPWFVLVMLRVAWIPIDERFALVDVWLQTKFMSS
jgi:hypothetical protein